MKQLQPVLWTKGTFLTPQHLQLQDRFLEDSLNFRLQALKFCAWGFSEVVLDQELLADGQLAISRASGIFPDGLLFDIPASDQPPPSKALAEFFDPGVRDLDIYLTVPDYREKGLNVSGVGRDRRFTLPGGDHHRPRRKHRYRGKAGADCAQESAAAGGQRDPRRQLRRCASPMCSAPRPAPFA